MKRIYPVDFTSAIDFAPVFQAVATPTGQLQTPIYQQYVLSLKCVPQDAPDLQPKQTTSFQTYMSFFTLMSSTHDLQKDFGKGQKCPSNF